MLGWLIKIEPYARSGTGYQDFILGFQAALRFGGTIVDECLVRNLPAMHAWPVEVHKGALIS